MLLGITCDSHTKTTDCKDGQPACPRFSYHVEIYNKHRGSTGQQGNFSQLCYHIRHLGKQTSVTAWPVSQRDSSKEYYLLSAVSSRSLSCSSCSSACLHSSFSSQEYWDSILIRLYLKISHEGFPSVMSLQQSSATQERNGWKLCSMPSAFPFSGWMSSYGWSSISSYSPRSSRSLGRPTAERQQNFCPPICSPGMGLSP